MLFRRRARRAAPPASRRPARRPHAAALVPGEALEARLVQAIAVAGALPDLVVAPSSLPAPIDPAGAFAVSGVSLQGTVVRMAMQAGDAGTVRELFVELYDREVRSPSGALERSAAPISTANFLSYVNRGRYDATFIHRATDFAGDTGPSRFLQGGGFSIGPGGVATVSTDAPIALEWADDRPNAAGTLAYARTSDPNSATSGFFFNTVANDTFDAAGNRYAVFGRVVGDGAAILAEAAALPRVDARGGNPSSPFGTLPVSDLAGLTWDNLGQRLLLVRSAAVVTGAETAFGVAAASSAPGVVDVRIDEAGRLQLLAGAAPGSATITVTGTDLSGARADDSFTVWVGVPAIAVASGGLPISSAQATPLPLGRVARGGAAVPVAFSVTNGGTAPLELGAPALPAGVTLAGTLPARVPVGGTAVFTLSLDAGTARLVAGSVVIPTNAPAGAFSIPVAGEVYGAPAAPRDVRATWAAGRAAIVTWSHDPADTAPMGSSVLFARRDGDAAWVRVVEVPGGVTSATVAGLDPTRGWSFRVTSANAAGVSAPSAASVSIMAPVAPAALLASTSGTGAARITWAHATQPFDPVAGRHRALSGYVLFHRRNGDAAWTRAAILPVVGAARVTGLVRGATYQFAIRARSDSGGSVLSPLSNTVRIR
jgi:peptidyl-prolyl cis-trans isomerase B (cyclophilin B)